MAKLNEVYQYKGPFTLAEQAVDSDICGAGAWHLVDATEEGAEDYTLLCSYVFEEAHKGENTVSWIDGTFALFDLLKFGKELYRIRRIADADGQVRGERLGVFYYNKAPSWIINQMIAITEIYSAIFALDFFVIPILNEEAFNIWLGDEPNRMDAFSDFVLVPLSSKSLLKGVNSKYAKWFKEEPEDKILIVPFQIVELDKEHVVIMPASSLTKFFNACFKFPLDVFKKLVLSPNTDADTMPLTLLSVTTNSHDIDSVEDKS